MSYDVLKQAFAEMMEIEANMYNTYLDLIKNIKNKKIILILEHIKDDEKKHENNVSEILKLLE